MFFVSSQKFIMSLCAQMQATVVKGCSRFGTFMQSLRDIVVKQSFLGRASTILEQLVAGDGPMGSYKTTEVKVPEASLVGADLPVTWRCGDKQMSE